MHTAKLCLAFALVAATSTHVAAVELVNPLQVLERSRRAGIEFDQRMKRDAAEQKKRENEQKAQQDKEQAQREAQRKTEAAAAKAAQKSRPATNTPAPSTSTTSPSQGAPSGTTTLGPAN